MKRGLKAFWDFGAASGGESDRHGSNNLTENPSGQIASVDGGRELQSSNSEYFSIAGTNPAVKVGDYSFCIWVRFKLNTVQSAQVLIGKDASGAREYTLDINGGNARFYLGDGSAAFKATSGITFTAGQTYDILAWFDNGANTMNIKVDGSQVFTQSDASLTPSGTNTELRIGARAFSGAQDFFDGVIYRAAIWHRAPSPDEQTKLTESTVAYLDLGAADGRMWSAGTDGVLGNADDSVMRPVIADLTLSGSADETFVSDEPITNQPGMADKAAGIRYHATGIDLRRLRIHNFRGPAVFAIKGGNVRNGPITLHDNEIGSASDIHMSKCFEGFVNHSDTDLKLHNISAQAIRGAGLHLRGAATQVTGWQHFYGCGTGILIGFHPDEGPVASSPNYLGGVTQCENCTYGLRNRYSGSTMTEFRGYLNSKISLWLEESMAVGKVNIEVAQNNAVGIQIDSEATDSVISSGYVSATGSGATGIIVRADRTEFNLHTSGNSQSLRIEGDTVNLLVDDCDLTVINGHGGDIEISDLGDGNRISIDNAAINQDADITINEIGTANEIQIINRGTGTVTLPASWDDDPGDGAQNVITINGVEQTSP